MDDNNQDFFQAKSGSGDDAGADLSMQPPLSTSSPEQHQQQLQIENSSIMMGKADSDFLSGNNSMQEEQRLEQERADLIDIYLKMKLGVQTHEGRVEEFKELVQVQLDKNKEIENDSLVKLREVESRNMMIKYQIVVTKLQTTVYNIARTTEAKKVLRLKRAFNRFADHARQTAERKERKKKLVYLLFETKLATMLSALERYTVQRKLHSRFAHWKASVLVSKQVEQAEADGKHAIKDLNARIDNSQQEQESLDNLIDESQRESEQTSVKMAQAEITLRELAQKTKKVQERTNQGESQAARTAEESRVKANQELRQKLQRMEAKIKNLQEENAVLLEKQEITNNSISDYISEMSTMLSSAELESALAMEHIDTESEDDYEHDERQLEEAEFEADEGRPHAGTGGSSKLRSRPQNLSYGLAQSQQQQQQPHQQASTRQRRSNQHLQQVYHSQATNQNATQSNRQQRQQR